MHRLAPALAAVAVLAMPPAGTRVPDMLAGGSPFMRQASPTLPVSVAAEYLKRRHVITGQRVALRLCSALGIDVKELRTRLKALGVPIGQLTEPRDCEYAVRPTSVRYPLVEILAFSTSDSLATLRATAYIDSFHSQTERASYRFQAGWHIGSVTFDFPLENFHP